MLPSTKNPWLGLRLISILLTQILPVTTPLATRASGCSKFFIHCSWGWYSSTESDLNSRGCRFDSLPLQIPQMCVNVCDEKINYVFLSLYLFGKRIFHSFTCMIQKLDISFTGPQKALLGFCLQGFPQTGPPQRVDCLIQVD